MPNNSSKKKKQDSINLAAQAGAASEIVNRYGSAEKGHFVAYSGKDNEAGKELKRGLKKIAKSKVNPDYAEQNIKQQAGFAAEDKYVARQNAEKIIKGEPERYSRTDDLGRVNDPLFDHVLLSEDGIEVLGSGEQMKFVGGNPKSCLNKLASEKFQKYLDADATITVPSDFYEGIIEEADKELASLNQQLEYAKNAGRPELQKSIQNKIDKYTKIKESVKDSGITNAEAIEARLHPKLSTAKDIVKLSHRAGIEQAKIGAAVGGGLSLIRNVVAVAKGDKSAKEAAKSFAKDTGTGAAAGYITAFAGSTIKGAMQNAESSYLQTLSKTNVPAAIVTAALDIGKSLTSFVKGDISGLECLEELGEKGTGQLSAAMFAGVGQIVIPIPVVGAMVGSMVGYALSSAFYKELVNSLKDAKLARERRMAIELECTEAIAMIEAYHADMDLVIHNYLTEHQKVFSEAVIGLDIAILDGNIDAFIQNANSITRKLGHETQFETFDEFEDLMNSDTNFNL